MQMAIKKTHEIFVQEVNALVGDEYTVTGEYKGNKTHIKVIHNKCGTEYPVAPDKFLRGRRCPRCFGKIRKTTEQFKEEVATKTNREYEVVGQYVSARTAISIRHLKCNNISLITPDVFLRNIDKKYCKYCHDKPRSPKKFSNKKHIKYKNLFFERVEKLTGDEYTILGEYVQARIPILMRHNKCGTEYLVEPNKFIHNRRCPRCKRSIGEEAISKYLIENNIKFKQQFKIKNCKRKRPLPFDFGVFLNKKLLLIEYQGELHYLSRKRFGGVEKLKVRQENDQIKRNFCIQNNITLLEIHHWDFNNIENILKSFIKENCK